MTSRYAHSEYQTVLSLRLKAALTRIAPAGTPRHFVVNTGAEAVENAIKAVLMNRVMTSDDKRGRFHRVVRGRLSRPDPGRPRGHAPQESAAGLSHLRLAAHSLSCSKRPASPKETARREERSLKQLWDLLVSGRLPRAEKSKDTYRREMDALDEFLAQPGQDVSAFVQAQRANLSPDVDSARRGGWPPC